MGLGRGARPVWRRAPAIYDRAYPRVGGLHARGRWARGVGLESRRRMLASLAELARRCGPGGPLDEVGAFCAVTVFHRGLARLGFAPERDGLVWPGLVAVYQRALLASLHPDGGLGSRRSNYGRACRL